jgi:hypothetical protein
MGTPFQVDPPLKGSLVPENKNHQLHTEQNYMFLTSNFL